MTRFPSDLDVVEYRQARARARALEESIATRCKHVGTPEEVAEILVELTRMRFCDGEPTVHVEISLLLESFRQWVDSQDMAPAFDLAPIPQAFDMARTIKDGVVEEFKGKADILAPEADTFSIRVDPSLIAKGTLCLQLTMKVIVDN